MAMSTPAIVLKSKFVMPGSDEYEEYVDYIDRDDAKRNIVIDRDSHKRNAFKVFHSYMDYMGDEEKDGELFSCELDHLNEQQKKEMKDNFKLAQKNGSPMWQDVISFDNDWLEEQGLYDPKAKKLNEEKMKKVVRESMNEFLKAERMNETAVWAASIHYNTDNIHVHIATIEPNPTRKK